MSDTIDQHIGRQLLRRRRALGLTQDQLGIAVGARLQQIQKYEYAANKLSASRLWRLAEALEVPVTYFFEGLSARRQFPETGAHRAHGPVPDLTGGELGVDCHPAPEGLHRDRHF